MGQIKLMVGLIMAALFGVAIITFAINFGIDNNAAINIANDSDLSSIKNRLINDTNTFYNEANISADAIEKSTINTQTESTEGGTAFKVGPWTALAMSTQIINIGFKKIFGSDTGFGIFLTALIGILVVMIALFIWKTWKGNPD